MELRVSAWSLLPHHLCHFGNSSQSHPSIVVRDAYATRCFVVCRSSQPISDPSSQMKHLDHLGVANHADCGIDRVGYVAFSEGRFVTSEEVRKRITCMEPDDEFFELLDRRTKRRDRVRR
jgi:hypothetical protein